MDEAALRRSIDRGHSLSQIAEEFGLGKSTVRYWLRRYDLTTKRATQRSPTRLMLSEDLLRQVAGDVFCMADCLRSLNLPVQSNYYPAIKRRLARWEIDTSHWVKNGRKGGRQTPLSEVLVKNSSFSRHALKKRILSEGILEERCDECQLPSEWNGKKLVLVLDHINGVNNDHRLENLRLLCPNCNSQTPTFSGRNVKR
jgi:hypothetical protein